MLHILEEIIAQIKDDVEEIGKENIFNEKPDPNKLGALPVVGIYDTGFTFEKIGIGEGMGITQEIAQDEYSGDGIKTKFKLKNSAVRPLISVEAPMGNKLREVEEYSVDYLKGEITFRSVPPKALKGKNNVLVTYTVAMSAGEVKGIRLKIICNIDIWAKNSNQCDTIALEIVRSLLFAEDVLSSKQIHLKPLSGMNLSLIMDGKDDKRKDLRGRRLIYLAESDIKFVTKVSQIRKIEISEKELDLYHFGQSFGRK